MPLPPELQARLSKRGLIKQGEGGEKEKGRGGESSATVSKPPLDYTETLVLPPNWKKITDKKTGHPYFWNTTTKEVSWHLPPGTKTEKKSQPQPLHPSDIPMPSVAAVTVSKPATVEKKERGASRSAPYKISKKPRKYNTKSKDVLDPMDPAAYSDVARGTWSSGLETGIEAKTGVDSTASGPLFQMRPYPSPGAILKMNQDKSTS